MYDVVQRRQAALGNSIVVKRKDWESAQAAISTLTFDRLAAAAKSVQETNSHDDPIITQLENQIQTIASQVPQSFALMRAARVHMRALFVSDGVPGYWMTINPSDLSCPLVITLAGVTLTCDELSTQARRIRRLTAQMNPVAVAQFFHHVCAGVFDALLAAGKDRTGILGEVSNYFGVVETNGRGMLHLHSLIWLSGNLEFFTLRDRLQSDPVFADRVIHFISSVIKCSVDVFTGGDVDDRSLPTLGPSAKEPETDAAFGSRLLQDANAVASQRQVHSQSHNATCFKYARDGSRECRFNYPRPLVEEAHVNSHGVIELQRNNQWVNPWNPSLASALRSNHDISFVPTMTMALSAVYYMTNYATKHDVGQHQLILTAALVKRALEDAKTAADPSEAQLRIRSQDMDKFALRAFNRLATDREISGPQAASCLLSLPDSYKLPTTIRRLNLSHLRNRLQHVLTSEPGAFWGGEETTRVTMARRAPTTFFEHYFWRGPSFHGLCLYEYLKVVAIKPMGAATASDTPFLPLHPGYETHIQNYSRTRPANAFSVAFTGSFSDQQALEDSVRGGHPETDSMRSDMALVLLALLVPWHRLPPLFDGLDCAAGAYRHHCADIWASVEPTLPPHLQDVARNVQLLRKCKEDARVDAALRREARQAASSAQDVVSDSDDGDSDDDNGLDDVDEATEASEHGVNLDALYRAFSAVKGKWADSDRLDANNIPCLRGTDITAPADDSPRTASTDDVSRAADDVATLGTTSDFHRVRPEVLQQWRQLLSTNPSGAADDGFDGLLEDEDSDVEADTHGPFQASDGPDRLLPIPDRVRPRTDPVLLDQISRLGTNPTGTSVARLVRETLPLNRKQFLVVTKILTHAIKHRGKTAVEADDQMLLAVAGEGGVGKTRVVKAVERGFELLQRKDEVIKLAPTGAAAYNIRGRTLHTALAIDVFDRPRQTIKPQVHSLWQGRSTLFVDEISMVSLPMLDTVNKQCSKICSVSQDATAVLGALPVVVFMGDFHQFAPISAQPLWQTPKSPRAVLGKAIWDRFTDVVILDEQMRQHDDCAFQGLLRRARSGTITAEDVDLLNRQVATSPPPCDGVDCICITRSNKRRHLMNRFQTRRFAEARGQDVYVYPGAHSRTRGKHHGLRMEDLLATQDGDGTAKGPGLFLYTKGMPVTILYNINTPLGLVNGARGTAAGIVPHPDGGFPHLTRNCLLSPVLLTPHSEVPAIRRQDCPLQSPPPVRPFPAGRGRPPTVPVPPEGLRPRVRLLLRCEGGEHVDPEAPGPDGSGLRCNRVQSPGIHVSVRNSRPVPEGPRQGGGRRPRAPLLGLRAAVPPSPDGRCLAAGAGQAERPVPQGAPGARRGGPPTGTAGGGHFAIGNGSPCCGHRKGWRGARLIRPSAFSFVFLHFLCPFSYSFLFLTATDGSFCFFFIYSIRTFPLCIALIDQIPEPHNKSCEEHRLYLESHNNLASTCLRPSSITTGVAHPDILNTLRHASSVLAWRRGLGLQHLLLTTLRNPKI